MTLTDFLLARRDKIARAPQNTGMPTAARRKRNRKRIALAMGLTWLSLLAVAADIAGVQVPETVTVQDQELVMNGAGLRSRFFVKIYVGALYVKNREASASAVLAMPGPKSIRLHILYDNITGEDLAAALDDGFRDNHSDAEFAKLQPRIEQFRALFTAVRRGGVVRIDMLANGSTDVWVNESRRGAIAGNDFQAGLLKIWIGDKPADRSLKRALLGGGG